MAIEVDFAPELNQKKVSELIGVPAKTLEKWRERNRGPVWYKLCETIKYKLSDVQDFIEKSRHVPAEKSKHRRRYPLLWYQEKEPTIDVMATLDLFRTTGKIVYTITADNPKLIAVEILNWRKYQSDLDAQADRARKYRKKQKDDEPSR